MLDADQLLEEGRAEAGLDDYGDMAFAEGLGVLVKSINEEAGLTPDNEAAIAREIVRNLVNRLRMRRDIVEHPEILEEEVLPPVFVTSLPRTGSTKLHRMLAATGDFNGLPFWMSYNFARVPGSNDSGPDPRIAAADEYIRWMSDKAPLYQQAHPQYTEEYEEELSLLDAGFNSLYRWAAYLNVPSYVDWVLANAGLSAFEDLRGLIQYIQWQHYRGLGRRWVFKTPSLFGFEGPYSMVFEGTDFIVTHRDVVATWPSCCQLICGVRALFNEGDFTPVASDIFWHGFGARLPAHLAWREAYPEDKVLDVRFSEIVGDEVGTTRKIYDWLGMDFTASSEANLRAWLEMDSQREHKANKRTLAEYGMEPELIKERFADYYERYAEFL